MIEYRDYIIEHDPPPIPDRRHDWNFAHKDYDGPGDPRIGTAASLEAAKSEIDELIADLEDGVYEPEPSDWEANFGQPNSHYG